MSSSFDGITTIFFDFMGTCLDWHSSVVDAFPEQIEKETRSKLAIAWREAFFDDIHSRFDQGLPPEDIDVTHARLLDDLTSSLEFAFLALTAIEKDVAVQAWHIMRAWPDIPPALAQLRQKYEIFVLANGTTRLQLDLVRSSGLVFDMLFSSQLLNLTKPDLEIYRRAMSLVEAKPENCLMVAAHAYDLRAAKQVGLRTVYIRRWTEDTKEDMMQVRMGVDLFLGEVEQGDGKLTDLAASLC